MKILRKKELEECAYRQVQNLNKTKQKNSTTNFMLKCFTQKCGGGGGAFAAEQKAREFKKILLRSKRFEKFQKKD